ncbi:TPA: polymer-forming cytoskeletal protein [Pseudomonas aeruginosa]|nr:polymer-forming cytoskeletal protein [Pseudomonas aeruginosa]
MSIMWSKNKGRADVQRFTGQTSLIASGAELIGDMNLKGAVQIDGTVRGALQAHEGLVRVSAGGRVDGEIRAPHVIIDGQVDGDIHAIERLELGAQARVKGNLHYGLIETAMGAQIEGRLCPMTEASPRPLELPASVETVD